MIKYHILPEQELIAICCWGKVSLEEFMEFSEELRGDPLYCQSYDSIIDNSQLESVSTRDEIDKLTAKRIDVSKPAGKIAIIALSDIQFGMSRMYEMVSEVNGSPQKIHVFRDSASALQWLGRGGIDVEKIFEGIKDAK